MQNSGYLNVNRFFQSSVVVRHGECRACGAQKRLGSCPFCIDTGLFPEGEESLVLIGKGRPGHIGPAESWRPPSGSGLTDEDREQRQQRHEAYMAKHPPAQPRRVVRPRYQPPAAEPKRTQLVRSIRAQQGLEQYQYGEIRTLPGKDLGDLADYELEFELKRVLEPKPVQVAPSPAVEPARPTTQQLLNKLRGLK